jgi:predicted ester cyclase
MSVEENKAIARRVVEEIFNKGNLALIPEVYAPNLVFHAPGGQDVKGPEGMKQTVNMLRTAFPDMRMSINNLVAEGDMLVLRYTLTGTHKGPLMGIPPTGKPVTMSGIVMSKIVNGKEVEGWEALDRLSIMQQLGVIPPMGQG